MYRRDGETWEDFIDWVADRDQDRQTLKEKSSLHVSELLFRGLTDAKKQLLTTLERHAGAPVGAIEYYRKIHAAKAQLETYTGKRWKIPNPLEYADLLDNDGPQFELFDMPGELYEYMVYLRHHSFPSPLLDWSASPYVAAFFAFSKSQPNTERVAIYAYLEHAGQAKFNDRRTPTIHGRGPHVSSHKRHFLQQSRYTVCIQLDDEQWRYACHENALFTENEESDLLWKFTLPTSERTKALKYLNRFGLNSFSLFGSEESLMEAVAMEVFNFQ